MQGKKVFWSILAWANALLCALFYAIKGDYSAVVASFEFAFFATLCIIFLSFSSYKKSVFKKVGAERNFTPKQNSTQMNTMQKAEFHAHTAQSEQNIAQSAEFQAQAQSVAQDFTQIYAQTPKICLKKNAPQKILKFKATNDEFKPTLKLAFKNFGVFFSLAKLGAYAFLALGFLALQKQDLLDIAAFLGGISATLLGVLAFAGFCAYKQRREI